MRDKRPDAKITVIPAPVQVAADDVLHEVRKAMRALRRVENRILADKRRAKRLDARAAERAELQQLALDARARAAGAGA